MKYYTSLLMVMAVCASASAASPARHSTVAGHVAAAPRMVTLSKSALDAKKASVKIDAGTQPVAVASEEVVAVEQKDMREKERTACMSNNIGIGNTFVWASKFSDISNYASMVEDTENPDNNVCFVRVELKSNDAKINISDMQGRYFEMGENITCGSWVDEAKLEKRILDAKKTARTLGTIAGAVGGAGIGVGAMELFGNKMIGGAVQGQKGLSGTELYRSQLLVLKEKDPTAYKNAVDNLKKIKEICGQEANKSLDECTRYDYETLLSIEQ